jgi:hypothetical protein
MIDKTQVLYEALTASSPLATAISTNCWSPIAPSNWNGNTKAIIFNQSGGGSHATGAKTRGIFDFKCYGDANSYTSARATFRLLFDRLNQLQETLASGTIVTAKLITDSQLPPEPDTQYKAHLATFEILFDEQ